MYVCVVYVCIGFSSISMFRWWLIAPSRFPGGFSFRHTGPFIPHAICLHVRIPPLVFCFSLMRCWYVVAYVCFLLLCTLLHFSMYALVIFTSVCNGSSYEFHFVSFIIETESDQCTHSNNHLLFPHSTHSTHIFHFLWYSTDPLPHCASISLDSNVQLNPWE